MPGPDAYLPQDTSHWIGDHGVDLHPGVDLGDYAGIARGPRRRRDAAAEGRSGRSAELSAGDFWLHHDVCRGQQRTDQHADGEPAGLRHEPRACPAASARQSASDPAVAFTTLLAFGLIT